jgi:hypothetical protein
LFFLDLRCEYPAAALAAALPIRDRFSFFSLALFRLLLFAIAA